MARISRESITTLIVDARGAAAGAAEFDRAAARINSAAGASQRIVERTSVIIGEQGKAYTRLLRQIDPTYAANEKFAKGVRQLDNVFKNNTGLPEYQRLLKLLETKYKDTGAAAREFEAAQDNLRKRARTLIETIEPQQRAQRLYNEALAEASELYTKNAISLAQYDDAVAHAAATLARAKGAQDEFNDAGAASGGRGGFSARQLARLSPQFSDIVTQAASGTSPLTILVQQGPQIADIFGGIPAVLARIPPHVYAIGLAFGALGTAAVIVGTRMAEISSQARVLEGIGRTLNPQIAGMAEQLRAVTMATSGQGASRGEAAQIVKTLALMRTLSAGLITDLAPIVPNVQAILGGGMDDTARKLGEAFSKGAAGVRELDETLHFLTPEQLRTIEQLDRQGARAEALRIAIKALNTEFSDQAHQMKSAWGQVMEDIGHAWDDLIEKLAHDKPLLGIMEATVKELRWIGSWFGSSGGDAPAAGSPGSLQQNKADIAGVTAEIARLKSEIDAQTAKAAKLQEIMDAGVQPVVQDEIDQAWARAAELNAQRVALIDKLAELEKQADRPQPPPAINNPPGRDLRGLTDDQIKRVNAARDAFTRETDAMGGNALQRSITLAGLEAFNASLARGEEAVEARQYQLIAMEKVERDIAIAIRDENEQLDLNIKKTKESADAYADSIAAGMRADAARQAALDALTTGADPKDRQRRILDQNAQDARQAANRNFLSLSADSENAGGIAAGAALGHLGEQNARRAAEAEVAYRESIAAAEAAGNQQMVAGLREAQTRYEGLLIVRDKFNDQTQISIQQFEDNRAALLDSVNIMRDGFEDLVLNGEQYIDVLRNMSKAFLQLGTDILVMQPLRNWMNQTLNNSSTGGTGIWGMLSTLGSSAVNAWAGGGPSSLPNAAGDAGAMSAADLLADWHTTVPVAHKGWHVGNENAPGLRSVPSSVFVNAPRLHNGGLLPGERAAILQNGEEVLTARNPRHRNNFRGAATVVMNITTSDANSFRQSQGQIAASAGRAISMAQRRNG
jgi:hypothetical protein